MLLTLRLLYLPYVLPRGGCWSSSRVVRLSFQLKQPCPIIRNALVDYLLCHLTIAFREPFELCQAFFDRHFTFILLLATLLILQPGTHQLLPRWVKSRKPFIYLEKRRGVFLFFFAQLFSFLSGVGLMDNGADLSATSIFLFSLISV